MSVMPINPRPMLQNLYIPAKHVAIVQKQLTRAQNSVGEEVIIRLKWGQTEYKGRLVSIDSYMNIQLSGAVEFIDQKETGTLGQVLIRCNNVLWIQGANQKHQNGDRDVKMEG